jgi:amidohydrolase
VRDEETASTAKPRIRRRIVAVGESLIELSRRIHAHPELGFEEVRASAWLAAALERAGLEVELDVFGLPTALVARAGSGSLHVALCAEYDALPEIGHACGHNLIAAMALGAACGLRDLVDDLDVTLTVLGTPAEELGNGKALLLERGAFEGIHAALLTHPAPIDVLTPPLLAFAQFDVEYRGRHGDAVAPSGAGVGAGDALTLAQAAIGMLRGGLRPTDRVHGVWTSGGPEPSLPPSCATATYMVRARTLAELLPLRQRVVRCFEAGAHALGSELEIREAHEPYAEMRHHRELAEVYRRNARAAGRVFPELGALLARGTGSTDMGNVSQRIPSIHPAIGIDSLPAANHQPEFTAHCVTPAAERALLDGATILASTIADVAGDVELRGRLMAAPQGRA